LLQVEKGKLKQGPAETTGVNANGGKRGRSHGTNITKWEGTGGAEVRKHQKQSLNDNTNKMTDPGVNVKKGD